MLEGFDRALLLVVAAAWVVGTASWTRRLRIRSGRSPVATPRTKVERAFPLIWATWLGAALGAAFVPDPCAAGCLWEPGTAASRIAGGALAALAFALAAWASWTLGNSWRVGVDEEQPGPVVTRGPYRWTRNPIFEGMLLALLGIVAWIPTLPLAALWLLSAALIRAQVAREERFLMQRFPEAYGPYARRTGRWSPRLSRGR